MNGKLERFDVLGRKDVSPASPAIVGVGFEVLKQEGPAHLEHGQGLAKLDFGLLRHPAPT